MRRGIVFTLQREADQPMQKTLRVTVEWVDDGVAHTNNLTLEAYADGVGWEPVSGDSVSILPNPDASFTGKQMYTYTVNAGVRYRLTAPNVDGYELTADVDEDPTLSASFRYISQTSLTATVTWVGDSTLHGESNDAKLSVYDGNGRPVTNAQIVIASSGHVQTYTLTGLNPDKLSQYSIKLTPPAGYENITSTEDIARRSFTLLNTAETATVTASVEWWDGHAVNRPSVAPQLQVLQGGEWVNIEAPFTRSRSVTNDQTEYEFLGLPKDAEYRVVIPDIPEAYVHDESGAEGSGHHVLIRKADFAFEKQWRDYSAMPSSYISKENWVSLLTLHSDAGTTADLTYNGNLLIQDEAATGIDDWKVQITGLPGFSGPDREITYYVTEQNRSYSGMAGDSYELSLVNYGNHAAQSDAIYDGGLSISTLTGSTTFTFTKNWIDGVDASARPAVTLYLYRFPINNGSFAESAPVQGMDNMQLPTGASGTFVYANAENQTALPKYDENGALYVYFILERMDNAGDYITVVYNDNAAFWNTLGQTASHHTGETIEGFRSENAQALNRYVLDGGTLENRMQQSISVPYSKEWIAKSVQGFQSDITVTLERIAAGSADWEPVTDGEGNPVTQILSGFKAELMTRTSGFDNLPKYDGKGNEYTYRVRETAVTVNGQEAVMSADGSYFIVDGYEFTVDYHDADNRITNTLVGDTEFQIRKVWNPEVPEGETASIIVRLYRNGMPFVPEQRMLPAGAALNADGTLTLTGAGTSDSWLLTHLPKYSDTGAQYTYTCTEEACVPDDYVLNDHHYTSEELSIILDNGTEVTHSVVTSVFTNTLAGDGYSLSFEMQKRWLDDNDLLHRGDVTVQLYYITQRGDDNQILDYEPVANCAAVLSDANQWYALIRYAPGSEYSADNPAWNVGNYFLREVSIADSGAESGQTPVHYKGASLSGECMTTEHVYSVTHDYTCKGSLAASVTVTNLRQGTVDIEVSKAWNLGGLTRLDESSDGLTAQFTVLQNGEAYGSPHALSYPSTILRIKDLPKYDESGVLYTYALQESGLNDLSFVDGVIEWNDSRLISSGVINEYVVGEHHTNDRMYAQFTNSREAAATIVVNKVWHDDGTAETVADRPDIVLSLYRQSVDESGNPLTNAQGREIAPALVMVDRLWDTRINSWYWQCSFGEQPLYDAQGYRYRYTVRERIIQASPARYQVSYYVPSETAHEMPASSPEFSNAWSVFAPTGESTGYTLAGPQGTQGTIINTRVGTISYSGRKVWSSLPAWFRYSDLPDITIRLYQHDALNADPDDKGVWYNGQEVTLSAGSTAFRFDHLPRFNEYGYEAYSYQAREFSRDDSGSLVEGAPAGYVVTYGSDGEINNCYTGTSFVEISARKSWNWDNLLSQETTYPAVRLTLYQCFHYETYNLRQAVSSVTLQGGSIPDGKRLVTDPVVFSSTDYPDGFPLIVPMGDGKLCYTYEIEETLANGTRIGGYQVSIASDAQSVPGEIHFTVSNTYEPELEELKAYKYWSDQSDFYGLRPDCSQNSDNGIVQFAFYRISAGSASPEALTDGTISWAVDPANGNRWICTFTPGEALHLYECDTNGNRYTYYVEETLADPYDKVYRATDTNKRDLSVTNTLNTVSLSVRKQWELNGRTLSGTQEVKDQLLPLLELLGIYLEDQRLTFHLTGGNDAAQRAIDAGVEAGRIIDTLSLSVITPSLYADAGFRVFTNLPAYASDENGTIEKAEYTVTETLIGDQAVALNFRSTTDLLNDGVLFTFSNAIQVTPLHLKKLWDDENNQDGLRPYTIDVTIQSEANGVTDSTTCTLSYESGWEYTLYLPVLINGQTPAYTVTEVAVDGYAVTYSLDDRPGSADPIVLSPDAEHTISITNTHAPQRFRVGVQKEWKGDENYLSAPLSLRPAEFEIKLQYQDGSAWKDYDLHLPDENPPIASRTLVGSAWQAEWLNLYVYKPKSASEDVYSSTLLTYRLAETAADDYWSYTASYSPATFTGKDKTDSFQVEVTNTLKTVTVEAVKSWQNDTAYNLPTRPETITLKLQYSTDQESWFDFSNNAVNPQIIQTATNRNTQTCSWNNLPLYDDQSRLLYYRIQEISSPAGYTVIHGNTTYSNTNKKYSSEITNRLVTFSIDVSKQWLDDNNNRYATRPSALTFTLEYTTALENGDSWQSVLSSAGKPVTLTLNSANGWSGSLTSLPAYTVSNDLLYYRVVEQSLANYTQDRQISDSISYNDSSRSVTFRNTLKVTSFSGEKAWRDFENRYTTRPQSLTVTLQRTAALDPTSASAQWENVLCDGQPLQWTLTAETGWRSDVLDNLPACDSQGQAYTYRLAEGAIPGYSLDTASTSWNADKSSYTLVNTLRTTSLTVQKSWNDQDNLYGTRPAGLTVTLQRTADADPAGSTARWEDVYADGIRVTAVLNDSNGWQHVFPDLPSFNSQGLAYTYRATEDEIPGYRLDAARTSWSTDRTSYTLVNDLQTTSLTARKIWDDQENLYGTRPAGLTVTLQRSIAPNTFWEDVQVNGSAVTETLSGAGSIWAYTFTGLPACDSQGRAYTYRVTESNITGYTLDTDQSGWNDSKTVYTLLNRMDETSQSVKKIWDDQSNRFGLRPNSLTVTLMRAVGMAAPEPVTTAHGTVTAVLSPDNHWTADFLHLPAVDGAGRAYSYTVQEEAVNGYSLSSHASDSTTLTDTLTNSLRTTEVTVSKGWLYPEAWVSRFDFTAPREISFELRYKAFGADEKADNAYDTWAVVPGLSVQERTLSAADWTQTLGNLPLCDAGGRVYRYVALDTVTGYTLSAQCGETTSGMVNTANVTRLVVEKQWEDKEDAYRLRPTDVSLTLQYSTDGIHWTDVKAAEPVRSGWVFTYDNLPTHTWKNGVAAAYQYRVTEAPEQYYVLTGDTVTGTNDGNGYHQTLTNTLDTLSAVIIKAWESDDPDHAQYLPGTLGSVTVQLQRRLAASPDEEASWTDCDPEALIDGFAQSGTAVLTEPSYTFRWQGLSRRDENGAAYLYRVKEIFAPEHHLLADPVALTENDGDTISGSLENVLPTTSLSVAKQWSDGHNALNLRPDSFQIILQSRVGKENWHDFDTLSFVPDTEGTQTMTIAGLPKYRRSGSAVEEIEYRAIDRVTGYVCAWDAASGTLTNQAKAYTLRIIKDWNDQDNRFDTRCESVSVQLRRRVAGGEWVDYGDAKELSAAATPAWTAVFENLPAVYLDKTGTEQPYEYSVTEECRPSYTQSIRAGESQAVPLQDYVFTCRADGDAAHYAAAVTLTLINTLETTGFTARKLWDDQNNRYATRPDTLAVTLERRTEVSPDWETVLADGQAVTAALREDNAWTVTFDHLPAVDTQGNAYVYRVTEEGIPGYALSSAVTDDEGIYTLSNALEVTSFTARKLWDDQDNRYATRPDTLTLTLERHTAVSPDWETVLSDGQAVTAALREDNAWTVTFDHLPAVDMQGNAYVYRVTEEDVPGYALSSAVTDNEGVYTLSNRLTMLHLNVAKVWDDQENLYHNRPETLTVTLESSNDNGQTWRTVTQNGQPVTAALSAPDWTFAFIRLPDQDEAGTPLLYRAVEAVPDGYMAAEPVLNGSECTLVNTLQMVSLAGEKHWDDADNAYHTRPDAIRLLVLCNGLPMEPQPAVTFEGWRFTVSGLPRYVNGRIAEYSVEELPVALYTAEQSIVTAVPVDDEHLVLELTNLLRGQLCIDNLTPNAARSVTDAGGFVGVGSTAPERDEAPYVLGATTVTWRSEEDWLHQPSITVSYREHDSTEWHTLALPDCRDLSTLKQRFPDARLEEEGQTRRLILADDPADMPMLTRVEVTFRPTIAVENTTSGDRGGQVRVETGAYSTVGDGLTTRYPQTIVYASASDRWMVDVSHLSVGIPASQHGAYADNAAAVPLHLQEDGSFTAQVALMLAGRSENVTLTGCVNVLKRDEYGNPLQIALTLNNLPANIDVGIPFTTAKIPSPIPQTGDKLSLALAFGGLCLAGLLLIAFLRRKRSK